MSDHPIPMSTGGAETGVEGGTNLWPLKLIVCVAYDLFDMTVGRLLFPLPLSGEVVGTVLCLAMFGKGGFWYAGEALDVTEQLDGFVPTATLIALRNRPRR